MKPLLLLFTISLAYAALTFAYLSEERQSNITNYISKIVNKTEKHLEKLIKPSSESISDSAATNKSSSSSVPISNLTVVEAKSQTKREAEEGSEQRRLGSSRWGDIDIYSKYPYEHDYDYPLWQPDEWGPDYPLSPPHGDVCQTGDDCNAILKSRNGFCAHIRGRPNICACRFGYRMVTDGYMGTVIGCRLWNHCEDDCQFDFALGISSNMECDYQRMRCICKKYYRPNGWRCV